MFANDFAGEAYFSLNGIPGLKGEKAGGYSNLKQTQLILTQPRPRGRIFSLVQYVVQQLSF